MSITRSHSRAEQVTEILVVSHGSPSAPDQQEAFIRSLADEIGELTGRQVIGATLAKPEALEKAAEGRADPLVYPHFMADGWFVSTNLQNRLRKTGLQKWTVATPLGLLDGLPRIALDVVRSELRKQEQRSEETTLVIAAHGSPSDPRPARATERFAEHLRGSQHFRDVQVGYVDENPSIEDAATASGPAIVLPFFAARAGHVLLDLPEALTAAGYAGSVLAPIGTWPDIAPLIADALCPQRQVEIA